MKNLILIPSYDGNDVAGVFNLTRKFIYGPGIKFTEGYSEKLYQSTPSESTSTAVEYVKWLYAKNFAI